MNRRESIVWVRENLHVGWLKAIKFVIIDGLRVVGEANG
jgi:hypothetical protein